MLISLSGYFSFYITVASTCPLGRQYILSVDNTPNRNLQVNPNWLMDILNDS